MANAADHDALREELAEESSAYVLIKRGLYWRPNAQGYTGLLREAGLYSAEDAAGHVDHNAPSTRAMLASEALEFAPECWPETKVKVLLADRAAAREEADRLRAERDEADRRAGAAERRAADERDMTRARNHWLRKAKDRAGYDNDVSFDRVWEDTLAKAESAERVAVENAALRAALKLVDEDARSHLRSDAIAPALLRPHALQAVRAALRTDPPAGTDAPVKEGAR